MNLPGLVRDILWQRLKTVFFWCFQQSHKSQEIDAQREKYHLNLQYQQCISIIRLEYTQTIRLEFVFLL